MQCNISRLDLGGSKILKQNAIGYIFITFDKLKEIALIDVTKN